MKAWFNIGFRTGQPGPKQHVNGLVLVAICWLGCFILSGCASVPDKGPAALGQQKLLREDLMQLHPLVEAVEADRVAEVAVRHSAILAHQYRAVKPAWLHNVLVNNGVRDRGLCYEWANDLYPELKKLNTWSLKIHLAVAHMDTPREHNAIIVTAPNQSFTNGVVLDPWRSSGNLWFGKASMDKYPWQLLPADRMNPALKPFLSQ